MAMRPSASKSFVEDKIKLIRAYHNRGRESLQLPEKIGILDQAEDLGCSETILRKARQFAHSVEGYSETELDELCDLLEKHRPVFGTSHIGQLVTIKDPTVRAKFQQDCIIGNWSLRDLKIACKKHSAPRSSGGRHPRVERNDALVLLSDAVTGWKNLRAALKRGKGGTAPILPELSKPVSKGVRRVNVAMNLLKVSVHTELEILRGGG